MDKLEFEPVATRDTIQAVEDIIPTKSDHGLDSPSTSHRLVGRDRPGNINATFRIRRICIETLHSHIAAEEQQDMTNLLVSTERQIASIPHRSVGKDSCVEVEF